MNPLLTTITPVWGRDTALRVWLRAIRGASIPEVRHIVYFVGENIPQWFSSESVGIPVIAISRPEKPGASIAHYHNMGAKQASTDWIMKLDVDCIAHVRYFKELIPVLHTAKPREWFNAGMLMISRPSSEAELTAERMPLLDTIYTRMMLNARAYSAGSYAQPEATNFVCRRLDYLQLGGADGRFKQYGWEDYQQIYMLERYSRGADPLPGLVDMTNVTQRCRDEISRPKAVQLYNRNRWLALLHRWHPTDSNSAYKNAQAFYSNRQILLDYISRARTNA
jgi:hypothetical protein